jgi:hypothetical protein
LVVVSESERAEHCFILWDADRAYALCVDLRQFGDCDEKAKTIMGATKTLTRAEAIEEYVVLRMRAEEIDREIMAS